jgi:hypothetical protein
VFSSDLPLTRLIAALLAARSGKIGFNRLFCRRALGVCTKNRYNREVAGRTDYLMCGSGATTGKKMGISPFFFAETVRHLG